MDFRGPQGFCRDKSWKLKVRLFRAEDQDLIVATSMV